MKKNLVLGISASLRNARRGLGNKNLIESLKGCKSEKELFSFLEQEALKHLENFQEAGRKSGLAFDTLYKNLKANKGDKGLSNSEVALAASLWSAHNLGSEIDHLSLAEHFSEEGEAKELDLLKEKLLAADGILLSAPVYFGDRGSLSQSLVNLIRNDSALLQGLQGKVYVGIAVGAKRNGGQETTLIYQLWDMLQLGFLGVGNDSETTSQYGGTGHAGDVGTMPKDTYGLQTSMGAGRRISRVCSMLQLAEGKRLSSGPRYAFLLLQDKENVAKKYVEKIIQSPEFKGEAVVIDIANSTVKRCLACDVCPTHIDLDESYRCIIKASSDSMGSFHHHWMEVDAIIPVVYSPTNRSGLKSNYQKFMERTRYLRRGDYMMSDLVSVPLVIEDLGANDNMALRMITSTLRHHTVLAKPLILYLKDGAPLNLPEVLKQFWEVQPEIDRMSVGRLLSYSSDVTHLKYNPVGYILSAVKDQEDVKLSRRRQMIESRVSKMQDQSKARVRSLE